MVVNFISTITGEILQCRYPKTCKESALRKALRRESVLRLLLEGHEVCVELIEDEPAKSLSIYVSAERTTDEDKDN